MERNGMNEEAKKKVFEIENVLDFSTTPFQLHPSINFFPITFQFCPKSFAYFSPEQLFS
jgi:hypothetical protein